MIRTAEPHTEPHAEPHVEPHAEPAGDPERWATTAIDACLEVWQRIGRRYLRRLAEADLLRSATEDVLALAARRVVPLGRRFIRPLPLGRTDALTRAFNRLDVADRFALRRLDRLGHARGARAEHLASALERLADALSSESREASEASEP
jgi:hypothetical protein